MEMDETLKKEIKSIITYIKETWNEEFHLYLDEESLCFATSNVDFYWIKDFRKYTSTINLEYQKQKDSKTD